MNNESTDGIICKCCEETYHYYDELVFLLGEDIVFVDEQCPDWTEACCLTCAEEIGLI